MSSAWGSLRMPGKLTIQRLPNHILENIIRLASGVDDDEEAQYQVFQPRHFLPNGPRLLQRIAEGDNMSEVMTMKKESIRPFGRSVGSIRRGAERSTYHPASRGALLLALVCKRWYFIAQPYVFRHLYVNDGCDWSLLALRLTTPVFLIAAASMPDRRSAGSCVQWLSVMSDDMVETQQISLIHILAHMRNLRGFMLSSIPSERGSRGGTKFTSNSTLISLFGPALSGSRLNLEFVSLTMSLGQCAVRPMLSALSTFSNARVFVLRFHTRSDSGQCVMHPPERTATFPQLRVLLFENMADGNYPYLTHLAQWITRALRSLFILSGTMVTGGRLLAHRNYPQLQDFLIQPGYFFSRIQVPSTSSLRRIVINVNFLSFALMSSYDNLEYIGLHGRLDVPRQTRSFPKLRTIDDGMRNLVRRSASFPSLKVIQFLDVVSSSFMRLQWGYEDAVTWLRWDLSLTHLVIRLVDRNGLDFPATAFDVEPPLPDSFSVIADSIPEWLQAGDPECDGADEVGNLIVPRKRGIEEAGGDDVEMDAVSTTSSASDGPPPLIQVGE